MQPFGRNRYGPKIGGLCPFGKGGAGSPPNTMWPGRKPICTPSFILIGPIFWLQCTNVIDKQDRQERQKTERSDSVGRTVLRTVAQNTCVSCPLPRPHPSPLVRNLKCGPMPNVMSALPNIGGAVCSTPQSLADAHY